MLQYIRKEGISNKTRLQHQQRHTKHLKRKHREDKYSKRQGTANETSNIEHKRQHINQRNPWAIGADLGRPSATLVTDGVVILDYVRTTLPLFRLPKGLEERTIVNIKKYKALAILLPPYLTEDVKIDGNMSYKGFMKDLLDEMKKIEPFEYDFEVAPGNKFGYIEANGSWVGAIAEIIEKRADFVAAPLTMSKRRSSVADFSIPFQITGIAIVLPPPEDVPEPIGDRLSRLFQPFDSSVWLLIFMSMLMTGTVLYVISRFNPYEWRRMMYDKEATIREGESFTCQNTFWFVVSASMLQGYVRAPRSLAGRVVAMIWWWFIILVVSCYIANLSNFLRIPTEAKKLHQYVQIKSLDDLAESDIPIAIYGGGSMRHFFNTASISTVRKLNSRLQDKESSFVNSMDEGIDFVRNSSDQKAFITELNLAMNALVKRSCDLYYVRDYLFTRYYSMAFPKNSPLKDKFDAAILKLQENGKLAQLERIWFKQKCHGFSFDETRTENFRIPDFHKVNLTQISGILLVLAVGFVAGAILTLVEILIYRYVELEPEPGSEKNDVSRKSADDRQSDAADNLLSEKSKDTTV
ncbi:hypothetical protein FSP39_003626 [Pinctada imbricata]|uniref:Uncharacterized protein n=1 Tax=Pinctada imbricata TaxID=66713 RepID=A0AA88Y200_PINIB|nr:hypothetical protein FSP39_003626 [Pinctada imbricata]